MGKKPDDQRHLTHERIWQAIDGLAQTRGLSASGLARRAGLDPTTFNRSKRCGRDGRPRWPSMESIARVLDAVDCSVGEFFGMAQPALAAALPSVRPVPIIDADRMAATGFFDSVGRPTGQDWDHIPFPGASDLILYALEVTGAELSPHYRAGDILIIAPTAEIQRGDRILISVIGAGITVGTATRVALASLSFAETSAAPERTVPRGQVAWTARIIWASQ